MAGRQTTELLGSSIIGNNTILNDSYNISLYIHIPFCKRKCIYCDFYSVTICKNNIYDSLVNSILDELFYYRRLLSNVKVKSIYIGGGTPSMLPVESLERLLMGIAHFIDKKYLLEYTIEANPESLTAEFLQLCSEYEVTRISMGIQSMNENELKTLGRPGNLKDNYRALELVDKKWKRDRNADILVGVPGQTDNSLRHSIKIFTARNFNHISLYTLTVENGTILKNLVDRGKIKLPDTEKENSLWFNGKKILETDGYDNYEISNFSKKDFESIHNTSYWEMEPYLGIGPSSVSTLPGIEGKIYRINHKRDIFDYLKGEETLWTRKIEIVSNWDFLFENLMMGLRLKRGVKKIKFKKRFGIDLFELIPFSDNFEKDNRYYKLKEDSRFLLDHLLVGIKEKLDYIKNTSIKGLKVNWP